GLCCGNRGIERSGSMMTVAVSTGENFLAFLHCDFMKWSTGGGIGDLLRSFFPEGTARYGSAESPIMSRRGAGRPLHCFHLLDVLGVCRFRTTQGGLQRQTVLDRKVAERVVLSRHKTWHASRWQ